MYTLSQDPFSCRDKIQFRAVLGKRNLLPHMGKDKQSQLKLRGSGSAARAPSSSHSMHPMLVLISPNLRGSFCLARENGWGPRATAFHFTNSLWVKNFSFIFHILLSSEESNGPSPSIKATAGPVRPARVRPCTQTSQGKSTTTTRTVTNLVHRNMYLLPGFSISTILTF